MSQRGITLKNRNDIFIDCFDKAAMKKAISLARKIVEKNRKDCNPDYVETKSKLKMMIVMNCPNITAQTCME